MEIIKDMTDYVLLNTTPPINNPALYIELAKHEFPMDDYRAFSVAWPHTPEEIKKQHEWQVFNGLTPLLRSTRKNTQN